MRLAALAARTSLVLALVVGMGAAQAQEHNDVDALARGVAASLGLREIPPDKAFRLNCTCLKTLWEVQRFQIAWVRLPDGSDLLRAKVNAPGWPLELAIGAYGESGYACSRQDSLSEWAGDVDVARDPFMRVMVPWRAFGLTMDGRPLLEFIERAGIKTANVVGPAPARQITIMLESLGGETTTMCLAERFAWLPVSYTICATAEGTSLYRMVAEDFARGVGGCWLPGHIVEFQGDQLLQTWEIDTTTSGYVSPAAWGEARIDKVVRHVEGDVHEEVTVDLPTLEVTDTPAEVPSDISVPPLLHERPERGWYGVVAVGLILLGVGVWVCASRRRSRE